MGWLRNSVMETTTSGFEFQGQNMDATFEFGEA
jgi:hypothetical protein